MVFVVLRPKQCDLDITAVNNVRHSSLDYEYRHIKNVIHFVF